jgi:hypothetical protein
LEKVLNNVKHILMFVQKLNLIIICAPEKTKTKLYSLVAEGLMPKECGALRGHDVGDVRPRWKG